MIQMVVLSGKGGTGKTSLTAAIADLAYQALAPERTLILVDADVDASNLEFVVSPQILARRAFQGGSLAVIDQERCLGCGTCYEVCRFHAVSSVDGKYTIDPFGCEGCASCLYQCPEEAISLQRQQAGEWYQSKARYGLLYHAHLYPAQENSGKLVALIKEEARKKALETGADLMLVDGPPGTGCPVISAVSGGDFCLVVTEPSLAGLHDLERILKTTRHFGVETAVCINKKDLSEAGVQQIRETCHSRRIAILGEIPFDRSVTEAMVQGQPITSAAPESPAAIAIAAMWRELKPHLLIEKQAEGGEQLIEIRHTLPD